MLVREEMTESIDLVAISINSSVFVFEDRDAIG